MLLEGIILALSGSTPYGDADMTFFDGSAVTAQGLMEEPIPGPFSAIVTPSTTTLPNETTVPVRGFVGDFYYRIWVIPRTLYATNPRIGVPIPFHIWNAFPEPPINVLTAIAGTGDDNLSLDLAAPEDFRAIEYREIGVTILNNLEPEISAEYEFTFNQGSALFNFLATVVQFISMRPDVPVKEKWSWLTEIIRAWDSGEQRIALRTYPRKKISYQLLVQDEDDRREQYDRWYRSVGFDLMIPSYQYATVVTAPASVGATKIFLDPTRLDVRDGESIIILDPQTEEAIFTTVATVELDGLELASPLGAAVGGHYLVAAIHRGRVPDRTGLQMRTVYGHVKVDAEIFDWDTRLSLSRPNSLATLTTFDGLNVLDRRPLAESDVGELFERGHEVLDNLVGKSDIKSSWPHAFPLGPRQFIVHRETDPAEMDWWRDFLDAARGRQNPFLMSTYRPDLTVAQEPTPGISTLLISEGRYVADYFPHPAFQRVEIELVDGSLLRAVVQDAELNPDGTALLTLSENFGAVTDIVRVSFLNLARLNDDDVEWEHDHIYSWVEIQVRAVDA